jgi:CRISPR-associated exonuclease Cas4
MRLIKLHIRNYRSIVDSGDTRIEPLQAFVGENNAGKSNLLYALQAFLTSGTGGVEESAFFDTNNPIIIRATFGKLTSIERKRLRPYLLGDKLIIEKQIRLQGDRKSGKIKPNAEYHGYIAKPKEWWLSVEEVINHDGQRPKWEQVASQHGILDYVKDESGKVTKSSYEAGIRRILLEREDIEFEEPELGQTQALGLQPVLLESLPSFHLLPAITDYSDEIDRRSSSTNFRRLMADLADRILRFDPRFQEIEKALKTVTALLNVPKAGEQREEGQERLTILKNVEEKLKEVIARLMPSVCSVCLEVGIEPTREIFSRGVSIWVDDGKLTEVVMKGHGLQRCVVFGLLQAMILNQRGQLISTPESHTDKIEKDERAIILAIEEPELYIHPQMQRLIYRVLKDFAMTDQVIYTTHSPMFIDLSSYEALGVIRKDSLETGTRVCQCDYGVLDEESERKKFQFLSSFSLEKNQMFFAKRVILVEGEKDVIAILATGRELSLFSEFPEELGFTIVTTDSKDEVPKYMKLLNAFCIPYVVLHELDGDPNSPENLKIRSLLNENKTVELLNNLEETVGHRGRFSRIYDAKKYFENSANIGDELKGVVRQLFT